MNIIINKRAHSMFIVTFKFLLIHLYTEGRFAKYFCVNPKQNGKVTGRKRQFSVSEGVVIKTALAKSNQVWTKMAERLRKVEILCTNLCILQLQMLTVGEAIVDG